MEKQSQTTEVEHEKERREEEGWVHIMERGAEEVFYTIHPNPDDIDQRTRQSEITPTSSCTTA